MLTRFITSLQHPIVKHLVKLREKKTYRQECSAVLISGDTLIKELGSHWEFHKVLLLEGHDLPKGIRAKEVYTVTEEVLKKVTHVESPETLCVEIPLKEKVPLEGKKRLLALDRVVDPGNLGTLLRTALALGFEGVFLLEGCCDPYNDKALRAAKGATFYLPLQTGSQEEFLRWVKQHAYHLYVADLSGTDIEKVTFQTPLILMLGNETHGPSPEIVLEGKKISILLENAVDSLNVATAGAICMHTIRGHYV